jgi:hypothetical protein
MRWWMFGLQLNFKVLKNLPSKKRISPSGEAREDYRDEEEILISRVSN